MLEKEIEKIFNKKIKEIGGLSYKFVSPNNVGVPDRIAVLKNGRVIFVELKTEKGRLTKIQSSQIQKLRKNNADVRVLYGIEEVEKFLEELGEEFKCLKR